MARAIHGLKFIRGFSLELVLDLFLKVLQELLDPRSWGSPRFSTVIKN